MPNLVLICSDQQRANSLGCTGNPFARTPNLDRLAAAGTSHGNCFACNTVCMPSRASLLTGCYPARHGVWSNGVALPRAEGTESAEVPPPHIPTIADAFAAAGHRTAAFGKLHLSPSLAPRELGFRESYEVWDAGDNTDWNGPYYGFEHVELTSNHGDHGVIEGRGHYGAWVRATRPDLAEACRVAQEGGAARPVPGVGDAYASPMTVEHHSSTWCGERASAWITEQAHSGNSFCCWVGLPDPHHPFTPPAELWAEFDGKPCVDPVDTNGGLVQATPGLGDHGGALDQADLEAQRTLVRMTDCMNHLIDRSVGRIVDSIAAAGIADDTIICFTSDHGEFLGDHGLLRKNLHGCRSLLNVPCIVNGTPLPTDGAIDNASLALQLAAACGVSMPGPVDGRPITGDDQQVAISQCGAGGIHRNLTINDGTHRLTWYPELDQIIAFNHHADPHETTNIYDATNPDLATLFDRLHLETARSWSPTQNRVSTW